MTASLPPLPPADFRNAGGVTTAVGGAACVVALMLSVQEIRYAQRLQGRIEP